MFLFIKRKYINKTKIIFLVLLIFLVSVWLNGKSANSDFDFNPRFTEPLKNNKYYYSNLNLFYKYGYGIPNCTAYAYGRAYEILNTEPKLCPYDAREWYDYNKSNGFYPYGNKAKVGALACFDNKSGGHIAVVEEIKGDKITFSNSGYGYKNFYLTFADVNDKNAGNSDWKFQGYIYTLN
jgi:surface antigen